jgi:phosphoribosylamine--glycine ligase
MRILIIGGGGREHALAWKIAQSPRCDTLYCAPGNPGIARIAQCLPLPLRPDFVELAAWCRAQRIDLVVVGPERPLAEGIVDVLSAAGIKCFGPRSSGARLESSKKFAKELMLEAGIPTAAARSFSELGFALSWLKNQAPPLVIKAVGLAEGKGVTVARTRAEGEFLEGEEASLLAFTDGRVIKAMDTAQDHKPVFDGDLGPNTGGMGSYSPAPVVTPELYKECDERVLQPCLQALLRRGIDYRGVV